MVSRALVEQIAKFVFSGGVAAVANIGVGYGARQVLHGDFAYPASVLAGFAVGTVVSFVLNRTITFAATGGRASRQLVRFALAAVVGAGIAAALATGMLFVLRLGLGGVVTDSLLATGAHVAAVGITTVYNFLAMKYFALRVDARPGAGGEARGTVS
jgi:putative flippase GtrA